MKMAPPSGAILLVFTYIHALLIDKDLCECQNILIRFPRDLLFMSFIWRHLHFFVIISSFYLCLCVIHTLVLSFSMWIIVAPICSDFIVGIIEGKLIEVHVSFFTFMLFTSTAGCFTIHIIFILKIHELAYSKMSLSINELLLELIKLVSPMFSWKCSKNCFEAISHSVVDQTQKHFY